MAVTIENQHIGKRYRSSRHNNKSAGFDTGFMSQFNQKPVRKKKRNTSSLFDVFGRSDKKDRRAGYQMPNKWASSPGRSQNQNMQKGDEERKSGSGFSFSVPSAATLVVIAGTIFVALIALKWENINIQMPERYVFQPATEDMESRTKGYAATSVPDVFHWQNPKSEPDSPAIPADSALADTSNSINETANSIIMDDIPDDLLTPFQWHSYKVLKGDTVSGIAQKYNVSVGAVIASNEIGNARRLQEGAALRIPNIDGIPYSIKRGDSLSGIAASFNVPLEVILDVNDIKSDVIRAGETIFVPGARMNDMDLRLRLGELFIYPLQNRYITSHYGMRKDPISGNLAFHRGVDLRGNIGAAVMAAMDGTVSVVSENWLYGKYIIISHGNGYKTLYAHLNSTSVRQGDRVIRGRKIGEVGNTGYSTGPHLHFGIYDKNGKVVNPLDLLH